MVIIIPFKKDPDELENDRLIFHSIYLHHGLDYVIIINRYPVFLSKFCEYIFSTISTKISPS